MVSHPDIDAIMDILGVCVLADRYERDQELVEMVSGIQRLGRKVAPDIILSRGEIRDWFAASRERLCAIHDDESATVEMLRRIKDPEMRQALLVAIFSICVCDYHLADEESEFLSLAMKVWKPGDPLTPEALEAIA